MSQSQDQSPPEKTRIRKGWVTVLACTGLAIIISAFCEEILWSWMDSADIPLLQSALISFGVAVFSAGLLLVIEPQLRTVVRESAETAVHDANDSLKEEILTNVESKILSLKDQIANYIQEDSARENEKLQNLEDNFNFENVAVAMSTAADLNAIYQRGLIVNATSTPGELRFGLQVSASRSNHVFGGLQTKYDLKIFALPDASENPSIEATWEHDEPAGKPFKELVKKLEAGKIRSRNEEPDWSAVQSRFSNGLNAAIKSRRGDDDSAGLTDSLIEVADFDQLWFLTETSIECPEKKFAFKYRDDADPDFGIRKVSAYQLPSKPEWAAEAVWDYIQKRVIQFP